MCEGGRRRHIKSAINANLQGAIVAPVPILAPHAADKCVGGIAIPSGHDQSYAAVLGGLADRDRGRFVSKARDTPVIEGRLG